MHREDGGLVRAAAFSIEMDSFGLRVRSWKSKGTDVIKMSPPPSVFPVGRLLPVAPCHCVCDFFSSLIYNVSSLAWLWCDSRMIYFWNIFKNYMLK